MTLRNRCKEMLDRLSRDAILRQGSPVDDLEAFVLSERGRSAAPTLENTLSVILYFPTKEDRDELVAAIREVKPEMVAKNVP